MMSTSANSPFGGPGTKIFLVGFMGSGKTHWGRLWAESGGLPFFDLDTLIEEQEQKTIESIFDVYGEEYFRGKENVALRSFLQKGNCILACGGGTPCFSDNMQWMNENGVTVYLKASPSRILERVKEEKDKRPLLKKLNQAEMLFFIEQKLKEREPFYLRAKFTLPVEELNINTLSTLTH